MTLKEVFMLIEMHKVSAQSPSCPDPHLGSARGPVIRWILSGLENAWEIKSDQSHLIYVVLIQFRWAEGRQTPNETPLFFLLDLEKWPVFLYYNII